MLAENTTNRGREFQFTNQDFEAIRKYLYEHAGISLNDGKRDLVYSRVSRRLRKLGIPSFTAYLKYINSSADDTEISEFINCLTTNLTSFFREPHHFEYLSKTALPEIKRLHLNDRRIRIWSAGCSTGEEPYSIAMVIRENLYPKEYWDLKILATDLDTNVLRKAKSGTYLSKNITGISPARVNKYFSVVCSSDEQEFQVNESLKELIAFKRLNLMQEWPMKGPFDLIFCRNVLIYFDKPTQARLFERFANMLAPNAYLFLGHSETMHGLSNRFKLIGQTMYQKVE